MATVTSSTNIGLDPAQGKMRSAQNDGGGGSIADSGGVINLSTETVKVSASSPGSSSSSELQKAVSSILSEKGTQVVSKFLELCSKNDLKIVSAADGTSTQTATAQIHIGGTKGKAAVTVTAVGGEVIIEVNHPRAYQVQGYRLGKDSIYPILRTNDGVSMIEGANVKTNLKVAEWLEKKIEKNFAEAVGYKPPATKVGRWERLGSDAEGASFTSADKKEWKENAKAFDEKVKLGTAEALMIGRMDRASSQVWQADPKAAQRETLSKEVFLSTVKEIFGAGAEAAISTLVSEMSTAYFNQAGVFEGSIRIPGMPGKLKHFPRLQIAVESERLSFLVTGYKIPEASLVVSRSSDGPALTEILIGGAKPEPAPRSRSKLLEPIKLSKSEDERVKSALDEFLKGSIISGVVAVLGKTPAVPAKV